MSPKTASRDDAPSSDALGFDLRRPSLLRGKDQHGDASGDQACHGQYAPLPRTFFDRPTADVARDLLGKLLVMPGPPLRVARIVEVEAYLGERDAASHARRGPTPRAAIMFGPPGHLYVYLIYGMHHCMNLVTEADGHAGAVLIRAAEPLMGFEHVRGDPRPLAGPGKVCAAFAVSLAHKGIDLCGDVFFVASDGSPAPRIARAARVGVEYAGVWAKRKLRFYVPGNPHVSKLPRKAASRRPPRAG